MALGFLCLIQIRTLIMKNIFESVTDQKVLTDFLKKLFEDKEVKNKF